MSELTNEVGAAEVAKEALDTLQDVLVTEGTLGGDPGTLDTRRAEDFGFAGLLDDGGHEVAAGEGHDRKGFADCLLQGLRSRSHAKRVAVRGTVNVEMGKMLFDASSEDDNLLLGTSDGTARSVVLPDQANNIGDLLGADTVLLEVVGASTDNARAERREVVRRAGRGRAELSQTAMLVSRSAMKPRSMDIPRSRRC